MTADATFQLVRPATEHLPSYVQALQRGWSPDNIRLAAAAQEQLHKIAADAPAFLAGLDDREAKGGPITLLDGTQARRLPGYVRWIWDVAADDFAGVINLRWLPGTEELPPHVLGHIGYGVVPWKQNRGAARWALARMLEDARGLGLRHVAVTTDPDNEPSKRVIEANGGVLVEHFTRVPAHGGTPAVKYRIELR